MKCIKWMVILFIALCLPGCSKRNLYQLVQTYQNIQGVEIVDVKVCYSPEENAFFHEITSQKVIDQQLREVFINDISELPCEQHFQAPPRWIEGEAIRIIYIDGSCEMIDADTGYYESANGETTFLS